MPFAQRIDIQNVSIIVSPVKRGRRPSTSPLVAEDNTADDYVSSHGYSSYPVLSASLDTTHIHDDDEPQGMLEFDQWDALAERESNTAYSIQDLPKDYDEGRTKFVTWCFDLVDTCDLDRSNCNIAISYLDRLVSHGSLEKRELSLAMATCVYIALKINSRGRTGMFFPEDMAKLTNYILTADQIIDMESHIFESFKWMMNPPVPQHFLGTIECVLKNHPMCESDFDEEGNTAIIGEVRHILYETSTFLCELSVMDTFFSAMMPSSIAIGAVLVAMDVMQYPAACSKWFTSLPLEHNPEEANLCAQQLHMLYSQQGEHPNCYYWSVSTSIDTNEGEEVRTVTPTKEDIPPNLKRMRQEMTVGSLCIEGEEEGVSPKKGRKLK